MYTLTLIRLSSAMIFQNTEMHGFLLLKELENKLAKHHADFDNVEKVLEMKKGDVLTVEVYNEENVWFYYITKI